LFVDSRLFVIIGGGPAGLFCALHASGENRKVLVLEKNQSCGRKLTITGSGQCNLTHDGETSEFFLHYGEHGHFLRPALREYTNRDLVAFFEEHGLSMTIEPGGKVFPASRKASDVLAVLLSECSRGGVELKCGQVVRRVSSTGGQFIVETGTASYLADAVVIATGGASYPATGSTGDGYILARELGHTVNEIAPALTPVIVKDYPFADLAGISFENLPLSVFRDNRKIRQHSGDTLLTHTGLSGPGVLDLSRFILPGDIVKVSFIHGTEHETVRKIVTAAITASGTRQLKTVLAGLSLPDRFARRLLELAGIAPDQTCAQLRKQARQEIVSMLTGFSFSVLRLGGFDEAMVTRGGVALFEINEKTMESKIVPNLFCIGELLDVDGDTGGYNLQAAFSTGILAARSVSRKKNRKYENKGFINELVSLHERRAP
jgi:predicted Rossmann fold flavoprotein